MIMTRPNKPVDAPVKKTWAQKDMERFIKPKDISIDWYND